MTPWELFTEKELMENSRHLQSMLDTFKEIQKNNILGDTGATMISTVEVQHLPNILSFPVLIS